MKNRRTLSRESIHSRNILKIKREEQAPQPDCRIAPIEAGHWMMVTRAREFNAAVLDWLGSDRTTGTLPWNGRTTGSSGLSRRKNWNSTSHEKCDGSERG